jgi:hypothetical protein
MKAARQRKAAIHQTRSAWQQQLSSMDHEEDDVGTEWNESARLREAEPHVAAPGLACDPGGPAQGSDHLHRHRQQLRHRQRLSDVRTGPEISRPGMFGPCGYGFPSIVGAKIGCPDVPVVGFAGDGAFGISMNEMGAIGREGWPAITMVIFRNYQWGAEKRNTTLWYSNNFVGTELNPNLSYAKVAEGCGLKGVAVDTHGQADRGAGQCHRRSGQGHDHLRRGHPQPGTRRALPPRRDEEAGAGGRHRPRRHAPAEARLTSLQKRPPGSPGGRSANTFLTGND